MASSRARSAESRPLKLSGRYRIEAELGRGGVGAVYRAFDEATRRVVALKTLERDDALPIALFEREYHTLASLKHPRVVEAYDFGITEDGRRYYTMELLPGDDLATLAPLPWQRACQVLCDVATSLALLHARRLLHRDVSPRNVRLDASGRAKLLDFGALCAFGTPKEIVGTPQCMAPEVVRQEALDQRADLFSLGCIAYWALTGLSPYSMRSVREAEEAYLEAPLPPRKLVAELPPALEQLVLSLLSIDPMERPSSAPEVIDRLHALAPLQDEPLVSVAGNHLMSSALVGREREKLQLHQQIARVLRGEGAMVVLEGEPGMGRTRLLAELAIDARIAGITPVRVEALSHPESNGVLRALAHAMIQALPAEALELLPAHLGVLGQVFEELRAHAPAVLQGVQELPRDAMERRARVQNAMARWVLDVAERRPLLVLIDDVHAADMASTGCLVALGHATQQRRLMLVVTHTLAEQPLAVQQLVRLGARIKLRGLAPNDVERLVTSIFGDAPHRTRLAQWLGAMGRGNPAQSLELLKDLVDRKVIRYEAGSWVLPSELSGGDLPSNLEEALRARLAQLEPAALRLAQLFALHRGPLPLSVCFAMLPALPRAELVAALDALVAREVLASSGDGYRFHQEVLRKVLLAPLEEVALSALHRELGRALIETHGELFSALTAGRADALSTSDIGTALQAGWYCVRGGDGRRGRAVLRDAAIELSIRGEGLAEAVPALEVALETYEKQGRTRYERSALLIPLALAGTYLDWRLAYRYGEELLHTFLDATGVGLARRLERFLGARLGLGVALLLAWVAFYCTKRRAMMRSFRELFLGLFGLSAALIGTYVVLEDRQRARRTVQLLRPLRLLPRRHPVRLVYEFQCSLADNGEGNYARSCSKGREVLAALQRTGSHITMPEEARRQVMVGICLSVGLQEAVRTDGRVHEILSVLDGVQTSVSKRSATGIRAAYHAQRGERARFQELSDELDVLAAQAGSTWREDLSVPRRLWCTLLLCEDVVGLKRIYRKLDSVAAEVPSLSDARDAVHACYLSERGMHTQALERHGSMFERRIAEVNTIGMMYVSVYARILRAAGQAQRARQVAEAALARLQPDDADFAVPAHGARIEHALALFDLGSHVEACAALDALIAAQSQHDNPLLHGTAHKARASIALGLGDRDGFEKHLSGMESWFRRTENPALITQCQRLADAGRAKGLLDAGAHRNAPLPAEARTQTQVHLAFNQCRGPAERLQVAVNLVVEASGAERGYLYLQEPSGLRFAAPNVGLEPPEELRQALGEHIQHLEERRKLRNLKESGATTVIPEPHASVVLTTSVPTGKKYRGLLFAVPRGEDLVVVGAIALVVEDDELRPVPPAFLQEVARGIYAAGDVCTVVIQGPLPQPEEEDPSLRAQREPPGSGSR